MADAVELKIYNQEDRLSVAAILIKNDATEDSHRQDDGLFPQSIRGWRQC